jgi:hypothetical protein
VEREAERATKYMPTALETPTEAETHIAADVVNPETTFSLSFLR